MTRAMSPGGRLAITVGVVLLVLFTLGPILLVGFSSLIPEAALLSFPPRWFQYGLTLDNYRYIFTGKIPETFEVRGSLRSMISQEVRQVPRAIVNSASVAAAVMVINIAIGSMAAYAFTRMHFRGRVFAFFFIMLSRILPPVVIAIPYYAILQELGLLNSRIGLILMYVALTLPFAILILSVFFRNVPQEVEEAALVDGCTRVGVLTRVTLPLTLPAILSTGLFSFLMAYNEFLFALLTITDRQLHTLPVILGSLSTNTDVSWGLLNAAVFLGIVPTLFLLAPIWMYMVRGLTEGYH